MFSFLSSKISNIACIGLYPNLVDISQFEMTNSKEAPSPKFEILDMLQSYMIWKQVPNPQMAVRRVAAVKISTWRANHWYNT